MCDGPSMVDNARPSGGMREKKVCRLHAEFLPGGKPCTRCHRKVFCFACRIKWAKLSAERMRSIVAKGDKLTQKDLMIWTMLHPNGTRTHYLLEKEPFLNEGFKKAVNRLGSMGVAVFNYRDQAESELAKYPPGTEESAVADGGDAPAGEAEDAASEEAGAQA